MEMRDLEYFAVVAKHGHVGRAAEALNLSQPALSKSLRRLEQTLQAKLVTRTPKGVELTAVGAALRVHVDRLRLSMEDVEREAADLSQGRAGRLHIGAGTGVDEDFMAEACATLLREAPRLGLRLTTAPNAELLAALRNGECDLVVSGIPHPSLPEIAQEPLYDEEFIVFASRHHRLAGARRVRLDDLAQERWALSAPHDLSWRKVHRVFEDHGLPPPQVAFETKVAAVRMQAVASAGLVGYGTRLRLTPPWLRAGLRQLPVKELAWNRSVGVSYRKDAYHAPPARQFLEILRTCARKL